jgi:hypothetical protein
MPSGCPIPTSAIPTAGFGLIRHHRSEVYRSNDQGENWTKVSPEGKLFERFGGKYGGSSADPGGSLQREHVYLMGLGLYRSSDGGKSWTFISRASTATTTACGSSRMIRTSSSTSTTAASTPRMTAGSLAGVHQGAPPDQFYNVAYDMNKPFAIYGSIRDSGRTGP